MELLALLLVVVALIWGVVYLRAAGLWGMLIATLLVGTVFGHPFFHIGSITTDRAMLGLSIGIYILYRVWGLAEPKPWNGGDVLFVSFIAAMMGTTFIHPIGLGGSKLLFYFLLPATMYFLARQIKLSMNQLRWLFVSFALLGIYLSITAVAEKFELRWAVYPRYIADPKILEFLGRGRGPLLNPSANGVVLTLGLSSALMIPFYMKGLWRVGAFGIIPIFLLGIYCTLTRCVWMGGAAALIGITAVFLPSRWRVPFVVLILGAGILGIAAKSESFVSFKRDKNVSVEDMRQSAHLRPLLAMIAWKMFEDRPLTGCGTGQYLLKAKEYLSDRDVDMPLDKARPYVQHNLFLAILVENGLVALVPFVLLLIRWSSWSWQIWRTTTLPAESRHLGLVFLGMMVGYIANGMFQDVLIMSMINSYLFFLAGTVRNVVSKLETARLPFNKFADSWRATPRMPLQKAVGTP